MCAASPLTFTMQQRTELFVVDSHRLAAQFAQCLCIVFSLLVQRLHIFLAFFALLYVKVSSLFLELQLRTCTLKMWCKCI